MGIKGQLLGKMRDCISSLENTTELDAKGKLELFSEFGGLLEAAYFRLSGAADCRQKPEGKSIDGEMITVFVPSQEDSEFVDLVCGTACESKPDENTPAANEQSDTKAASLEPPAVADAATDVDSASSISETADAATDETGPVTDGGTVEQKPDENQLTTDDASPSADAASEQIVNETPPKPE